MHCEQAEMLIPQYIFNELTAEDAAQIAAHLTTCASCTQSCKELKEASSFLESALKAPTEKKFSEEKRQQILTAFSELKPIVEPIELAEAKKEIKQKPSFDFKTFFVSIAAIFLVLVGLAGLMPVLSVVKEKKMKTKDYYITTEILREDAYEESNSMIKSVGDGSMSSDVKVLNNSGLKYTIAKVLEDGKQPYQSKSQRKQLETEESSEKFTAETPTQNNNFYGVKSSYVPGKYTIPIEEKKHPRTITTETHDRAYEESQAPTISGKNLKSANPVKQISSAKQKELGNRGVGFNDKAEDIGDNNNPVTAESWSITLNSKVPENADGTSLAGVTLSNVRYTAANEIKSDAFLTFRNGTDVTINKDNVSESKKSSSSGKPKEKWGKKPNNAPSSPKASGQNQENEPLGEVVNVVTLDPAEEGDVAAKPMRESEIIKPEEDSRWPPGDEESKGKESWYKTFPGNQAGLKAQSFGEVDINEVSKFDFDKQKNEKERLSQIKRDDAISTEIHLPNSEKIKELEKQFPNIEFNDDYLDGAASFDEGYIQKTESKTSKEKKSELAPLSNDQLGGVSIWKDKKNIESQKDKKIEVLKAELAGLQEKSNVDSEVIDKLKRLAGNEQSSEFSVAKETENKLEEQTADGTEEGISDTPQVGAELMGNIGGGGGAFGTRSGGGKKKAAKSGAQILEEMNQNPSSVTSKSYKGEPSKPKMGDIPMLGNLYKSNKPKSVEEKQNTIEQVKEKFAQDISKANAENESNKPSRVSIEDGVVVVEELENRIKQTGTGAAFLSDVNKLEDINLNGNELVKQKEAEPLLKEITESLAKTEEEAEKELVDVAPIKVEPKKIVINPFVNTSVDALSTFSIDTDSASYYVCRQSLLSGVIPHESVVRPEEFINAFDYNYSLTGQKTFAINTDCIQNPFNSSTHILKVGIKGKVLGRDGRKPVHVVLVVDTSGSMAKESRLPMVKKGIEKLVTNMQPGDRVSLVTYGSDVTLNLEYTPVEDIDQIQNAVESLKTGGSTDLAKGVMVGYQIAATHFKKGAMNQVMICSDGVANVGHLEADKIIKKVEAYKKQGVSFTSIGFGSGDYNDQLLQKLALRGDGFYYYVNNEEDVKRVFEKEIGASFNVIAKDVKLQVAFKENRVLRYRLIGYEAREVKDKDFRNNAVDGGEIISGKSVTAIYELELAKAESAKEFQASLGTVTVRFQNVENNQWEEDAVAITGKIQMVASPRENPYFYLAYCAATFAEIMRKSPYVNPNAIGQIEDCVRRISEELVLNDQVKDLLKSIQAYEKLMVKDK